MGVIAVILVLFILREPKRGFTDGYRQSKGVKGKAGFSAYLDDIVYLVKKYVGCSIVFHIVPPSPHHTHIQPTAAVILFALSM